MAVSDKELIELLSKSTPSSTTSGNTYAAALSQAESSIPQVNTQTADSKLDSAINEYLNQRGFNYNTAQDKDYQNYLTENYKNSLQGATQGVNNNTQLANGYVPTYSNAVASEIYNEHTADSRNDASKFKSMFENNAALNNNQLANILQLRATQSDIDYNRQRNNINDQKAYMEHLANQYYNERSNKINEESIDNDIYNSKLSAALENVTNAENLDNQQYLYNTQSADNKAQIAKNEYENNLKIAYNKAEDNYNKKFQETKQGTQNANAVFAGMKNKDEFNNYGFEYLALAKQNSDELTDEQKALMKNIKNSEKKYGDDGVTTYELYAKQYIDSQYNNGNINEQEKDYLYNKAGITGEDENYYNSGIADSYIKAYDLDRGNNQYVINQLAYGYNNGNITLADVNYISKKLGVNI